MYKNKKRMIGILGLGFLLGHFGGESFAAPGPTHLWDDGGSHKADISEDKLKQVEARYYAKFSLF